MIEEVEIDGRKAIVSYLDDDFRPVPKGEESLVKIIFENGDVLFGVPTQKETVQ